MANLSSLLSVSEPKGFWITIIKAFESFTNNYVLAIILITLIIRVVWSFVELGMKYSQQQMSIKTAQMQPELDKLKQKYANQPQVLQQKQNELSQKYYGKSQVGSCLVMLLTTALNMVIFFTLFAGLNTMSSYKNSVSYDSIKYTYANCINVTDKFFEQNANNINYFEDYEKLSFEISGEGEEKVVKIIHTEQGELFQTPYRNKEAFTTIKTIPAEQEGGEATEKEVTNENIIALIQKYIPVYEEGEEIGSKEIKTWTLNAGTDEETTLYFSTALQNVAMKNVVEVYDQTKESFLWIENIWIADSPMNKSIVSYSSLAGQIGKKNIEEGEEIIYNAFMQDLKTERSKVNGYFIIPLLCIGVSVLSMFITNLYNNRKNAKKGLPPVKQNAGWMKIVLPLMLGMFALFYNSVFAIYMLTGQIVSTALAVPQLMLIDHIIDKKIKKEQEKNKITVDYARKF